MNTTPVRAWHGILPNTARLTARAVFRRAFSCAFHAVLCDTLKLGNILITYINIC